MAPLRVRHHERKFREQLQVDPKTKAVFIRGLFHRLSSGKPSQTVIGRWARAWKEEGGGGPPIFRIETGLSIVNQPAPNNTHLLVVGTDSFCSETDIARAA